MIKYIIIHLICDRRIHFEQAMYSYFHAFFTSILLLIISFNTKALVLSNVCKSLHLRCLNRFWMCQCYVSDNYLSVNSLHKSFCNFLVCRDSKLFIFQLLWFFMKLIHLQYNWQQNRIAKIDDIFQSVLK